MDQIIVPLLNTVAIINLIFAAIILSRGFRNTINILFGFLALGVAVWSIAITGFYSADLLPNINWAVSTHISALFLAMIFYYFALYFPRQLHHSFSVFPVSSFILTTYYLVYSNAIIGATQGDVYEIHNGYIMYAILVLFFFVGGYYILYKQYKQALDDAERKQIEFVLIGSVISSSLASVTDLILPYFHRFELNWLGPVFTLALVISIFFAILKYRLFNIKVIISEVFSVLMVLVFVADIYFSKTIAELIFKSVLAVILIVGAYVFIKSVYKEVEAREAIEGLAKKLESANTELEATNGRQENLIHFVSHEVKSYLNKSMAAFSGIAEGDYGQ